MFQTSSGNGQKCSRGQMPSPFLIRRLTSWRIRPKLESYIFPAQIGLVRACEHQPFTGQEFRTAGGTTTDQERLAHPA